ncbi:MAG: DUF3047 domain-containing protein [Betaproteobacteria bacterium]
MRAPFIAASALLLAACASVPPAATDDRWHPVPLPGKAATRYEPAHKDGRPAVLAVSDRSASLWRRHVEPSQATPGEVSFSWWAQSLLEQASVADVDREDATARVVFGFGGDQTRLSARTRMSFDLAEALTGERPPYATLMYVWDATAPVGSVIVNPRSDRIRKIVVDSGPEGLRRWRDHRRDLAADFRLAFGEEPGPLRSVALMTDSDNTRSRARTWYGEVVLKPRAGTVAPPPS